MILNPAYVTKLHRSRDVQRTRKLIYQLESDRCERLVIQIDRIAVEIRGGGGEPAAIGLGQGARRKHTTGEKVRGGLAPALTSSGDARRERAV